MSDSTLRVLLAMVLILHGIGHGLGILSTFGLKLSRTQSSHSPILNNLLGDSIANGVGLVLWVVLLVVFVVAGIGLLGYGFTAQWQTIAIFASILSLIGLFFYWNAFPLLFPHKIGAIAADIGTIVCLVWLKWPSIIVT